MNKKIFRITKTHIYIFGILANVLPLIGLAVIGWNNFSELNMYQLWAWVAGAIYYIFMWIVALALWRKFDKTKKESEVSKEKIIQLEERIKKLEEK